MSKTKKEQIFDAAASTILKEGVSQLTLQQVAEHANMKYDQSWSALSFFKQGRAHPTNE